MRIFDKRAGTLKELIRDDNAEHNKREPSKSPVSVDITVTYGEFGKDLDNYIKRVVDTIGLNVHGNKVMRNPIIMDDSQVMRINARFDSYTRIVVTEFDGELPTGYEPMNVCRSHAGLIASDFSLVSDLNSYRIARPRNTGRGVLPIKSNELSSIGVKGGDSVIVGIKSGEIIIRKI